MEPAALSSLRDWFSRYCRTFYVDDADAQRNILLKEEHTHRVCANMELLVESLGLDEGGRRLAMAVALFHDVGRFEQYRRYGTFSDAASVNHAALGARVLTEERVLDTLPTADQSLIIRAVALHNAFVLPTDLDGTTDLHLRLIRDADKLDIWRVFLDYYRAPENERASAVSLGFADRPECSAPVLDSLREGKMVNLSQLATLNDFKLLQLSWVHDLNFPASFRLAWEQGYLAGIAATLPPIPEVREAAEAVLTELERRGTL
ncbi:HD domain-containing protein [Geomobilimonas luticola]|uniref:HD domain-containing protein n=1 Tax=Geomobilimonas luticola TaxID=1114878 RepID=A0ABS5SFT2_9BACT|nr:HD domain-containing protein [Geomobilimonas luticola]MBT0653522.1 HD domain-containing protein [Geomobilimonas luticola]